MPIRLNFGQGGGYQRTFDIDAWLEEKKRQQGAQTREQSVQQLVDELFVPADTPAAETLKFNPEIVKFAREIGLGPVPTQPSTIDKIGEAFHENPLLRALSIASTSNILSRAEQGLLEKAGYAKSPLIVDPETKGEQVLSKGAGLAVDAYVGGRLLKAIAPAVGGAAKKAADFVSGLPAGVQAAGGAAAALGVADTARGAFTPDEEAGDRSFLEQTGASLRYGTGQLLETAGGIAKWRDWEELGESLGTAGQKIKEGYETEPQEFSWRSFFDPDFYAVNVAQSLPMTLSLIPAMYGGYRMGGTAGARMGFNPFQKAILASLTGAGVSRPLESAMEAGAVYEDAIKRGMDPDKAEQAANSVFKKNLSLVGLDAAQLAAAFAPWKGLQAKTKLGKIGIGAGKLGFEAFTEAGEEGIQEVFQRQGMGDPIAFDPQMKEAMAIGGIFGLGMGGAGVIKDTYESIRGRTIEKMPEEMQTQVRHHIETEIANGTPPDQALDKALDAMAETEEGKQVIHQAVQEINEEVNSGRVVIMPYSAREEKYGTLTDKRSMVTGAEGVSGPPVVYDNQGRRWIVLDDTSDPSRIKVQSENGAITWLGRKVVSTEPPAGVSPAQTDIAAPQETEPGSTDQRQPAETGQAGVNIPAGEIKVPQTGANVVERQPWEMTRDEFINWSASKTGLKPDTRSESGVGTHKEIWERGHKVLVKKALSEGRPVPAEVLAAYPDLVSSQSVKPPKKKSKQAYEKAVKKELQEFEFTANSLKASYNRHKELMEKGGADPFWPDGVNLDLVRNHIINHKRKLKALAEKHGLKLPEEYGLPLPNKVPHKYMSPGSQSARASNEKGQLNQLAKHQQEMPEGLYLSFSGENEWSFVRYDENDNEQRSKSFRTPEEAVKAARAESAAKPEKKEEAPVEQKQADYSITAIPDNEKDFAAFFNKPENKLKIAKFLYGLSGKEYEEAKKAVEAVKEFARNIFVPSSQASLGGHYNKFTPQQVRKLIENLGIVVEKATATMSTACVGERYIQVVSGQLSEPGGSAWHEAAHAIFTEKPGEVPWEREKGVIGEWRNLQDKGLWYAAEKGPRGQSDWDYGTKQTERYARLFQLYMSKNPVLKRESPVLYEKIEKLLEQHIPMVALFRNQKESNRWNPAKEALEAVKAKKQEIAKIEKEVKTRGAARRNGVSVRIVPHDEEEGMFGVEITKEGHREGPHRIGITLEHAQRRAVGILFAGEHPDAKTPWDTEEIIEARAAQKAQKQTCDINTPERKQLRRQKQADLYRTGAPKKERKAWLVMGPPASGKSTLSDPLVKETGSLLIDADEAKKKLPEYNDGKGADAVHEESSKIAYALFEQAVENGDNIVVPIVGRTLSGLRDRIKLLKEAGYKVNIVMVDLPVEKAAQRAITRFYNEGRFVDPDYVYNKVALNPRRNYVNLELEGECDSYEAYSTDVPKGEEPPRIENPADAWGMSDIRGNNARGDDGERIPGAEGRGAVRGDGSQVEGKAESQEGSRESQRVTGNTTTAKTERGTAIEAMYAVVPIGDLIASHNIDLSKNEAYPEEIQPRQRERAASEEQINRIAANLEPDFLGESPKASEGAPIIGPDMVVESGNGRIIALMRVYKRLQKNAAKYKTWLADNAEKFGLDKDAIGEIKNPVLVRIRLTEVDRAAFAREANEQSVASMSATEQAKADAEKLTGDILNYFVPSETGEIHRLANADFIRNFMEKVVGPSERGRYVTADGDLSQEGITRIKNAIFAKAYGDVTAIAKLAESTDNNVKNITNAMLIAAPRLAKVKEGIERGDLHDLDISADIAAAMKKLSHLREVGDTVDNYLNQVAMFEQELSDIACDLLDVFNKNKRHTKRIAGILKTYADMVTTLGDPKQVTMFSKTKPTKAEMLLACIRKVEKESGETDDQTSLFQDQAVHSETSGKNDGRKPEGQGGPKPYREIAEFVAGKLKKGEKLTSLELFRVADKAYGGTQAQGKYTPKDAYDAMELGVNKYLEEMLVINTECDAEIAERNLRDLKKVLSWLPTQTSRTAEMDDFQQFSTPPNLAYVAAWAANINNNDTALEPSAGIGGLAVFAKKAGARVIVNELAKRRLELLKEMGFDEVFNEDAEQLNNVLPDSVKPTVVIMNPPFSAAAGRMKGTKKTRFAEAHLEQALLRLQPGGRLVAIVGRGMADKAPAFRKWWDKIKADHNVRANIGINGSNYKKYGTTFDVQILVIDKTGATPEGSTITGSVTKLEEALPLLEGVRNDRAVSRPAEQTPDQSDYTGKDETGEGQTGSGFSVPPSTSGLGAENREGRSAGRNKSPRTSGSARSGGKASAGRSSKGHGASSQTGSGTRRGPVGGAQDSSQDKRSGESGNVPSGQDSSPADRGRGTGTEGDGSIRGDSGLNTQSIHEWLNNAEQAAWDRIGSRKGRLMAGLPMDDMLDYTIIGAAKLARGMLNMAEFSASMLSDITARFGEAAAAKVRPWLPGVYAQSQAMLQMTPEQVEEMLSDVSKDQESEKKPEKKGQKKKQPKEKQEKQEEQEEAPLEEGPLESEISIEEQEEEASGEELTDAVFANYKPQKLKIPGAVKHPGHLAQSAAMAAVEPPAPTYVPNLPKELIEKGKLSDAQLESVVYAGQAHQQVLPSGQRRGFFIGDGTGVGKGREIAGIIWDNMRQGRKKAVWISKNAPLLNDARRDFKGVGLSPDLLFDMGKIKQGTPIKQKEGTLFTTYNTLSQNLDVSRDGNLTVKTGKQARIDQLVEWLGADFDGVIAFDEAHHMKNSLAVRGKRGIKKPAAMALAGVELQRRLPNARIVYVSATGATEVINLAYADRLGLWGEGTAFPNKIDFVTKIHAGGLAAMELVARDMKAMGSYLARTLSFDGVTYGTINHKLTADQLEIYNAMAKGWQVVLQNIHKALEETNQGKNGNAKSNAMSRFWGSQQRFFNQILTSMQMPSVIEQVRKDLADGKAVVMQLVNTNEAAQNRQVSKMVEGDSLEDLDLTPRDMLMQYIEKGFPTQQYEEYMDEDGNIRTRPVVDSQGNPVHNKKALAMKEELLTRLGSMKVPEGPLEIILNTFGVENVAEITGRTRRIVRVKDVTGKVKAKMEKRTSKHAEADAADFMGDKKKILVFSNAGGTGRSYHASLACKNQRQRIHYLIQPGWIADNAVQGFGRTHRTNQANTPHYVLVTTDLKGQKRFISSIARRLDQLGALTKGQRQTGSQGLFSAKDNLENSYAKDALQGFYEDLIRGRVDGLEAKNLLAKMGLEKLLDEQENAKEVPELRDVTKFLNRILALESDLQNDVFDAFSQRMEAIIDHAAAEGTLDVGLENFRADKIRVVDEKTVFTDKSGAETKYVELEASYKNIPVSFEDAGKIQNLQGFYYNKRSKRIYAAQQGGYRTLESGRVVRMSKIYGQTEDNINYIESNRLEEGNWEEVKGPKAKEIWDNALGKVPEYRQDKVHLITGAILPIWDRLPDEHVRVIRVKTDDGRVMLGRIISDRAIDITLSRLNASRERQQLDLADIVERIIDEGYIVNLANGWRIARRYVSREQRIEIIGNNLWQYREQLQKEGVFTERIRFATRFFIPAGEEAAEVFARVTEHRPVLDVVSPEGVTYSSTRQGGNEVRERPGGTSYREAKERLDEKVDEAIGDVNPPAGFSIRVVGDRSRNAAAGGEYEGIENEEIRERFEAAKGVPRESMREKISELITRLKNMATREFEHLPRTAEFSRLRNDLLSLAKQKGVSSYKTLHTMMGLTINLNKKQYNTFRNYVILADLVEEMRAGHDLPFGFDADNLKHEWKRVRAAVNADPEIQRAVNDRKNVWDGLINDYVAAQEAIGHHVEGKFNRQNYYRHQVLEYAQAKSLTGTGKKLKTPSNRGFLKKREGSALDINTDYLQADYEVMARMLYDIEVANVINRVNKKDNIINQVRDDAKRANKESLDLIIQKEKAANKEGISSAEMALKSFRSRIAMGFSGLRKMAKDGTLWQGENGEYEDVVKRLAGEEPEVDDDAPDRTFFYLSDLLAHGEEGASKAGMILKAVSNRKVFIKDLLGKKYKTWEDVIPDGYTVWQPREGNIFFMADTIPANLADQLYNRVITELGVKAGDLNKVLVMGGKRPSYVLKDEVAATLDELVKEKDMHPFLRLVSSLQRYWKIWQLVSPRRWFKYNFRNLSGDAEAVFVGNPAGFKKLPQAFKDLYPVFKANKSMPPDMRDWFERGGMETLLQAQELSDINQLEMFARLERNKGKLSELPVRAWQGYWKAARLSTDFREALLRYANYLSYLEQMESNGGQPKNFGASIPEEVMALDDIKDRAFKLSNELLGAYDQVGVIGQQLRQYLIPFWSWNEVNFRRTKQLMFNAARDGDLAKAVGRNLLKTAAVRSPFIAYRVGKFALKAAGLWVMLQLWNEWKWPEEEKSLPLETRARPHIIFGKDKDGKVIYFDRLGFVQDFLSWFGLDESPLVVRDYLNGKRTLKEIALSMAKSPVNKLVTGLGPIVKTPAELLYGKSSYPDAFKMRSIRDRWQYLADSLGLGNEYKLLAGKPMQTYGTGNRVEGYWKSWEESFIYKADPMQSAYYDILDAKNRYLKEKGEESSGTFTYTPRSNALYNFKLAVRYKDKEAARQALTEYAELGGTNRGLEQSLKTMNPMYGLNKEEQVEFIQYLDTEERGKLLRAIKYYETTLMGK